MGCKDKLFKGKNKRGLSPVVATVLLISIVIAIAVIVFLWLNGLIDEPGTKMDGQNVETVCRDVEFEPSYSNSTRKVSISNEGNVGIYDFKVRSSQQGNEETEDLQEITDSFPENGLSPGGVSSFELSNFGEDFDSVDFIPVLVANSDDGRKEYVCEDNVKKSITL